MVFASPHSGSAYPPAFVAASRLDPLTLRGSEDAFVDELFAAAPAHGAPLLAATFPRVFCDANREAWELDQAMFEDALPGWVNTASPRVAAGLGTIARVVSSGEAIYRGRLSFAEAERRVATCWRPWHVALDALVARTRQRFGACLLIDCHSMPSQVQTRRHAKRPDFVLGDAHGASCDAAVTQMVEAALTAQGFMVARNDPYAGGYTTRHYAAPDAGRHTLQIEIARDLYMDERRIEKTDGFAALRAAMDCLAGMLAREAQALLRT